MKKKQIKKVKSGIKACSATIFGKCYNCPYYSQPDCLDFLLCDAIEYIKELEFIKEALEKELKNK